MGWTIGVIKGKPVFFYDAKGFQYVHKLLSKPGEPIRCIELADVTIVEQDLPAIDDKALAQIRGRYKQLDADKQHALNKDNAALAAKHEQEQEEIEIYLKKTTGKGGRIRKHGLDEKTRQNVKKAIDAALDKIRIDCPDAFTALMKPYPQIITGYECTYIGNEEWLT